MNKSLKQSVKERLKIIAKERNLTFEEVWHNLVLERFLARLTKSKYKGNFHPISKIISQKKLKKLSILLISG